MKTDLPSAPIAGRKRRGMRARSRFSRLIYHLLKGFVARTQEKDRSNHSERSKTCIDPCGSGAIDTANYLNIRSKFDQWDRQGWHNSTLHAQFLVLFFFFCEP
jgi:hypothetical protein